MEKIQSFLKTHSIALAFSFVVGLLSVLPTILAPLSIGDDYKGIQFLYLNDETTYRTRIHEILDGHPGVVSPFLYEYKDSISSAVPPINEFFYAIAAIFIGLHATIIFAKFFFPLTLFLLIYALVSALLAQEHDRLRKLVAIAAGATVTLGYDLVDVHLISSLLSSGMSVHLSIWTRLVNPIVSVLLSFGTFFVSWRVYKGERSLNSIILAVLLALSVGYFFGFGVCYAFVSTLTLFALIKKEYKVALTFMLAIIGSLILDFAYWYQMIISMGGEAGRALALKNGMYFTHQLVVNKIVLVGTLFAAGLYVYYRRISSKVSDSLSKEWQFIAALVMTAWIVFGQQVVTGRTIWIDHFVQFTIPMMVVVLFIAGTNAIGRNMKNLWVTLVVSALVVSLGYGIFSALSFRKVQSDFVRQQSEYGDLVEWFNLHADHDCVVLSREWNEELERLLPGYTSCNVYNTQYAYAVELKDRVLHNFLLRMRLLEISTEDVTAYLYDHETEVRGYFFENWDQMSMRTQGRDEWLKSKVAFLSAEYKKSVATPLDVQIRKYRIDYLVAMQPLSPELLKEISDVRVVSTTTKFVIYEIGH